MRMIEESVRRSGSYKVERVNIYERDRYAKDTGNVLITRYDDG